MHSQQTVVVQRQLQTLLQLVRNRTTTAVLVPTSQRKPRVCMLSNCTALHQSAAESIQAMHSAMEQSCTLHVLACLHSSNSISMYNTAALVNAACRHYLSGPTSAQLSAARSTL
eukprot:11561-Heterococcus_DN1.PRE.3